MFEEKYVTKKRSARLNKKAVVLLALIAFLGSILFLNYPFGTSGSFGPVTFGQILGSVGQLLIAPDQLVKGQEEGEINVLLLGVGGNGYYGSTITDTIMIASIKLPDDDNGKTKVSLFSIPRDLAVELPSGNRWHKINEAYTYGQLRGEGIGGKWISDVVTEWTGMPIHYYAVVDFGAFRDGIDAIGGVEVDVEREFTDYSYPDYNFGTQTIHFDQGFQYLDGERALQYTRSRKGNNGEGSDFARARRQQKVIWAVKEKVESYNVILDIRTISRVVESLSGKTDTDLELWQMKRLYDLTKDVEQADVVSNTLDPRTGLVCSAIDEETQLYVLRLCEGKTLDDIRLFAEKRFTER